MNDAKEYRRNAAECTSLAQEITNTEGKELLLYMAGQWRELAEKAVVVTGFDLAVQPSRPRRRRAGNGMTSLTAMLKN